MKNENTHGRNVEINVLMKYKSDWSSQYKTDTVAVRSEETMNPLYKEKASKC